jgi:hypothetical protein
MRNRSPTVSGIFEESANLRIVFGYRATVQCPQQFGGAEPNLPQSLSEVSVLNARRPRASLSRKIGPRSSICESLETRRLLSTAISSGQTILGSISTKAEVDTYTIKGVAGGTLMATAADTTTGSHLIPQMEFHAPGGNVLTASSNTTATGTTLTALGLTVTGTYTITLHDANKTATGAYAITAVSIGTGITPVAGTDGGPITSGVTKTAAISTGDIDAFTITGKAGGTLIAAVGETTIPGGPVYPDLELFSPSGAKLTDVSNEAATIGTALNLPVDGTYTVIVRDLYGSEVFGYKLKAISLGLGLAQNIGGDGGPLTSGVTKSAEITDLGGIDTFTITGKAGGTIIGSVGDTLGNTGLSPDVELYSPTGARLADSYSPSYPVTGTEIGAVLPMDGTYTIIVHDFHAFYIQPGGYYGNGPFDITAVSIGAGIVQNSGGDGGLLASGSVRSAAITAGDIDVDQFYGVAGDKVVVTATESVAGSPLSPVVLLIDTNGQQIGGASDPSSASVTVKSLPTTGLYSIVVEDAMGSGTGGYKLLLTQTPSAVKPTVTIAATDKLAVEGGFDNGKFTITRTNVRALPETIKYTVSGTAKNGADYTTLSGTAVIPANSASVGVVVTALTDSLKEGTESVVLTLGSGSLYTVGSSKTATVSIDDPATVTGTVFADANSNNKPDSGEGLSGWTVWIDINGNGTLDSTDRKITTDSSGNLKIIGLPPGTFKVYVTQKTGYKLKSPAAGYDPVTLTIGSTVSGVLFNETKVA